MEKRKYNEMLTAREADEGAGRKEGEGIRGYGEGMREKMTVLGEGSRWRHRGDGNEIY